MRGGEFLPEPLPSSDLSVEKLLDSPSFEQLEAELRPSEVLWTPKSLFVEDESVLFPPERGRTLRSRLDELEQDLVAIEEAELHGRYADQINESLADGYRDLARATARAIRDEVKFLQQSQSPHGVYLAMDALARSRIFRHTLSNQWVADAYRRLLAVKDQIGIVVVPRDAEPIDLEDTQEYLPIQHLGEDE